MGGFETEQELDSDPVNPNHKIQHFLLAETLCSTFWGNAEAGYLTKGGTQLQRLAKTKPNQSMPGVDLSLTFPPHYNKNKQAIGWGFNM